MATKKEDALPEELQNQGEIPQTEANPELEEMDREFPAEGENPKGGISQTDSEDSLELPGSEEFRAEEQEESADVQIETEMAVGSEPSECQMKTDSQTEAESAEIQDTAPEDDSDGEAKQDVSQTEPEKPRRRGRPRKTAENHSQSGTGSDSQENDASDGVENTPQPGRRRAYARPALTVLSIDERLSVETEADKAKNDLLDLLESQKTGRILTGTIQGVERPEDNPSRSLAVIYHGEFKIIIPAEEAVEPPADYRGRLPEDVLHYMLTKRLGAEVDYIVKGIDPKAGLAVGSRLEAMRAKRRQYYFGTDRDGNNLLYSGVCAEARIVSVIRAGIFVDLFGLEIYIPLRELSYQRWMDAAAHFQPGQRVLVKVLEVDRSNRNQLKAVASVKQAGENPYEKALRRYSVGNRYVGTVSMVDTNGVFVALDGGIDCLCSYPKRGRPPRGSRVTVRILGINHDSNRIWGAITHIAAAR